MKWLTRSIVPSLAALAALVAFLPRTGPAVGLVTNEFSFASQRLVVDEGESITIRNDGNQTHSFTCPKCGLASVNVQPGQAKVVRFPRAGTFEFFCIYHADSGMVGQVVVEGSGARPAPTTDTGATGEPVG